MKHLYLVLFIIIIISGYAQTTSLQHSPPLTVAPPENAGISAERLNQISNMITDEIQANNIPGAIALVARNGKIVYQEAFGKANVENGREFKNDDIFRIASQSKAITATAIMMLWEEAKFRLDDPISNYIPEFKDAQVLKSFSYSDTSYTTVSADKPITIRHLLTHTSGIGYGAIDGDERMRMIHAKAEIKELYSTEDINIGDNIKKLAKLPLHHHPGEKFTYSLGLDVLGYLVEILSGKPFDEYLRNNLLDPLGMVDTWFYLPADKHSRLVPVQHKNDGNWERFPNSFYDQDYPKKGAQTFFSGGAGLSSTAEDYAAFLQMYLNKGEYNGVRILSRTTVEMMMENQIGGLWEGNDKDYGIAFGIVNTVGKAKGGIGGVGTFDWGGYFNTQYFADPEENIIGIIMKQTEGYTGDQSGWKFRQLVFQSIDD